MLVKETSWTISSARNLSVCISSGSSSKWWQSVAMRRPNGISSEATTSSGGSFVEENSTSRSHSRATRVQPASCILERYMDVGSIVTFSRMRSCFFIGCLLDGMQGTCVTRACNVAQFNCRDQFIVMLRKHVAYVFDSL